MDCQMPIMDGYEATRSIIKLVKDKGLTPPRIVAITGNVEHNFKKMAQDCGMDELFEKPVQAYQLKQVLVKTGFINENE